MIRLTIPSIEEDDLQAVREALISGYLVQGEQVAKFEKIFSDHTGCKHAVAVSSCTAGLHMALLVLGVQPGDIVIVTTYSWIATANVIELCGAKPAFVDICPHTFNIDPDCLERTLDKMMANPEVAMHVKVILPVHTFGQMADMVSILNLANRYDLPVIEDAACAVGANLDGRQAGTWGVMGCFSLHPRKAITTGEGGVITTNDSNLASRLQALRNHGQDPDASQPDFIMPGFNYRMTEFQAALGQTQMKKLDRIIASRRHRADTYSELLQGSQLKTPTILEKSKSVYQSYVVLLNDRAAEQRNETISRLKENGIETTIGTLHMPMTTYFRTRYGYKAGDYPVSENIYKRSLTLPLHEYLTRKEQEKVVQCLQSVVST